MNETVDFQTLMLTPFDFPLPSFGDLLIIGILGGLILTVCYLALRFLGYILGEVAENFDAKNFYMSFTVVLLWLIYIKL